jgi:Metallo-peptidase family M12B Reprolysin-like/Secretion system C-terminal sorting domain
MNNHLSLISKSIAFALCGFFITTSFSQTKNGVITNFNNSTISHNSSKTISNLSPISNFNQLGETPIWKNVDENSISVVGNNRYIQPDAYRTVLFDLSKLKTTLAITQLKKVAASNTIISLPNPDGTSSKYKVYRNTTMHPTLEANFPEIRTYDAIGIDNPSDFVKFDITPHGFHAMIFTVENGVILIDPYSKGDVNNYQVYYKKDYSSNQLMTCELNQQISTTINENGGGSPESFGACELRTYRLALACTGEYATAVGGGTVAGALAAQVTTMNRVNGIYERDIAVTMTIIANNNLLIYTNAGSDPYTNNSGGAMLGENQTNINTQIGSGNYDIGHVFSTGGGGVAGLGVVCNNSQKARGVTGSPNPQGDAFDIDYVAHEIGHQFRGNHTFNGTNGSCGGGNRNLATAYEPGSGTTIMAYAGICTGQNVQSNSDALFHGISLQEIGAFITTGGGNNCPVITPIANNSPTMVSTNGNVTIPANTPFALTATATDPDGDILTYTWEQMNNDNSTQPPVANATGGPNFRALLPSTSPTRYFPNLTALSAGGPFTWEVIPSVNRTMNFRAIVRDNAAGAGCNDEADVTVTVDAGSGPFVVTYPSATGITWTGATSETVTWNEAGTAGAPVSCATVDILLSTDGGLTYPTVLASSVPNNGSSLVTVPNTPTTTARVMIICSNGTFFDISDNNFTIVASTFDYTLSATPTTINVCPPANGTSTINIGSIGGYNDPVTLSISGVPAGATSNFSVNPVTPIGTSTLTISNTGAATPGTYTLVVQGNSTSGTKSINITLVIADPTPGTPTLTTPANGAPSVPIPANFAWSVVAGAGVTYDIDIATDAAFASIVDNATGLGTNSYISGALAGTTPYFWRVRATTACGASGFSSTFTFTTAAPIGCDTLNFPPPGTLTVYPTADGYVTGWNVTYMDVSKAEYFSAASHAPFTDVTGGVFYIFSAADGGNGATVDFNIWDATGTAGAPGTIIGTTTVPLATLNSNPAGAENGLIEILFNTAINVGNSDFYFGLAMNGFGNGDSLGIVSNTDPDTSPATAWEEWGPGAGGGWYAFDGAGSWGLGISMFMSPYMTDVLPTAVPTANVTTLCEGNSVNFDGSTSINTSGYNWIFPGGTPSSASTATASITYAANGNYMAYLVVDGQCQGQAVDSIAITVNSLPTITANATNTVLCTGDPVTLTGSGGVSYSWDNSVTDGTPFNPTVSTTYTVTGTDANSCQNTDQVTVTITPPPTVVANATNTTICAGDPVTLTGSGATSYSWNNGVTDGTPFNPTVSTTYTVTGTTGSCNDVDQITITVNALPTVVANATNTTICAGDPVTLTGSGATGYSWNNGVTNGTPFNPTVSTTYTVTGTDANSCQNTNQVTVTVNALPTVVANATTTTICNGDPVTLTGSGATGYSWNNGVTNGTPFNPTVSTTYTVTGTDVNSCQNTDQVTVTVNALPTVVANATTTTICNGDPVTLTGSGATGYSWNNGVTNGTPFNPTVSTTYTVTGTDANSCQNTDQITVTVNALPTVVANATTTTICNGDPVTLTGSGATSYSWNNGVTDGTPFNPTTSTTYTVTGTDANSCQNTDQITVTVGSVDITTSTAGNIITANATGATYQWIDCGSGNPIVPAETAQNYTATVNGDYAVIVTQGGCTDTSACINIIVLSINDVANGNLVSIYPNPTSDEITIDLKRTTKVEQLTLFDAIGKIAYQTENISKKMITIDMRNMSKGIYTLQTIIDGKPKTFRIVKE